MTEGKQRREDRVETKIVLQLHVENLPSRIIEIVMNRSKEIRGIGHGIDEEGVEINVFTQTKYLIVRKRLIVTVESMEKDCQTTMITVVPSRGEQVGERPLQASEEMIETSP